MRRILLLAILTLAATAQTRRIGPTDGRRLALVIGNQDYQRKPLRNARADARSMEALLRQDLGFTDIQKVEDTNLLTMQREIRAFVRKVRPGDLALFYYSGHGMQVAGNNWMIPVDFHADFEDEVPDQAYSSQRLLKDLEDAGAAVRIIILDACRDNPLPAAAKRSGKDGLIPMPAAEGTYLLFATAENRTADDNPRGNNGLFTSFLLEAWRKPGTTVEQAFKETRRQVSAATGGKQRPWLATDIDRDVVLAPIPQSSGKADEAPPTSPAPTAPAATPPAPRLDLDVERYNAVKDSKDPDQLTRAADGLQRKDLAAILRERALALRSSITIAEAPKPVAGRTKTNPADGLTYVWIPPGRFRMGCSAGDKECYSDEKPAKEVEIKKGLWIGQTEVTQAAYERVIGSNPSEFKGGKLPVERVSWLEAGAYCGKVGMRLPTEAEWEYAARAGSESARYGSVDAIAWYGGNSGAKTHEVGGKEPNVWGLYDMLGNVREWTSDWYEEGKSRTLRGGSWNDNGRNTRVSLRSGLEPDYRFNDIGFRCIGE